MALEGSPVALITGVAGQDGVLLARLLLARGYRVVGTTSPGSSSAQRLRCYLGGVETVELDIVDGPAMAALLARVRPDEIYNLAAMSSVGESWKAAERVAEVNGMAVLRLLESLLRHRDATGREPRFYQASSSEVFGLVGDRPQDEGTPHHPRSPYAAAKSFAHHLTVNYRESYGLFACNGILFNHESPLRPARFVTRKITQAVAEIALGRRTSVSLGTLDVRRDWGAAADYVEAMWLMLQQPTAADYVIATGHDRALQEFLETAFACAGLEDPWRYVEQDPAMTRPADVPRTWGNPQRARDRLGWSASTPFDALVAEMVAADLERVRSGVPESPRLLLGPVGPSGRG